MNLVTVKNATRIKGDFDYREAVNLTHTDYYNPPCTILYKGKKYIIGAGTADRVSVFKLGNELIVHSVNTGLSYVGVEIIDLEDPRSKREYFLKGNDIDFKDSPFYKLDERSARYAVKVILNNFCE